LANGRILYLKNGKKIGKIELFSKTGLIFLATASEKCALAHAPSGWRPAAGEMRATSHGAIETT
jgi:hypothetical protein